MKKTKKILIGMTAMTLAATPIISVISCGSSKSVRHFNLLPTYTGQADQLIALGVGADYYPLQLDANNPYEYLTNPGKFMSEQSSDFKDKFAKRVNQLLPKTKGVSWWNQTALSRGEKGSDPAYWQQQEGGVLLYEHYLLDDDAKIIDNSTAPKHADVSTIQTNFRWSRDPFTRIPKAVFYGWDLSDSEIDKIISSGTPKSVTFGKESINVDKQSASIIKTLRNKGKEVTASNSSSDWLYNDFYFVQTFHEMFIDNNDFQQSDFANWLLDPWKDETLKESPFANDNLNVGLSDKIKKLFDASTFQSEEIKGGIGPFSMIKPVSTVKTATATPHHPIYDQQSGEVGAAPMFEGAMRDNQLYIFNVAWQLSNLVNYGTPYGKDAYDKLPETIKRDETNSFVQMALSKEEAKRAKDYVQSQLTKTQIEQISHAYENANKISSQLHSRMKELKSYFDALKSDACHNSALTFGLLTIAPGAGQSTIQSMSKYSFLYKELGFAQPVPTNIDAIASGAQKFTDAWNKNEGQNPNLKDNKISNSAPQDIKDALGVGSIFNMDDNGWFWTVGESGKLEDTKLQKFAGQFDLGAVAARNVNWDSDVKGDVRHLENVNNLFKDKNASSKRVDYDLWNEGLKTPFVMHMILDQVEKQMENWYLAQPNKNQSSLDAIKNSHSDATSWGTYFAQDYIQGL